MTNAMKRTDPTAQIVRQLVGAGTGTLLPVRLEKQALVFTLGTGNGSLFSWKNPEGVSVMASIILDITTAGTGTAGVDIGVGTLAGSSDTMLDGGRVDAIAIVSNFGTGGGTNAKTWRKLTSGGTLDYITGKLVSDLDSTAAGQAYIIYIPIS